MKPVEVEGSSATLTEFFPRFLEAPRKYPLASKTRREYEKLFKSFIEPRFGRVRPGAIARADVISFIEQLQAKGAKVSQIEHGYRLLRAILGFAVDTELIPSNPAERLKGRVPRKEPSRGRALTYAELLFLAREIPAWCRPMVLLMGLCGLRIGEAVALKVGHVDLASRAVTVQEAFSDGQVGPTKTRKIRVVPMPKRVAAEVAPLLQGKLPEAYVFTTPAGNALRPDSWRSQVFRPATVRAGLTGITPHDLRRTARSLAEIAGASPEEARAMGGWSSYDISVHYLRVYADRLRDVADRFDEGLDKAEEDHGSS
ncbi:MAG: tyrosine-type recombinase/integrase [Actinomycetota bacterium]